MTVRVFNFCYRVIVFDFFHFVSLIASIASRKRLACWLVSRLLIIVVSLLSFILLTYSRLGQRLMSSEFLQ